MYFKVLKELRGIIDKHALADKSLLTCIEKGINTGGYKPTNIVAAKGMEAQVVTSERSQTITVMYKHCWVKYSPISGVSRQTFLALQELLDGATTGCVWAMSDKGYLNTDIFNSFLKNVLAYTCMYTLETWNNQYFYCMTFTGAIPSFH